ncbi:hypothetical protein [Nonomuraea sp. LPB2021202275-12-8]
MTPAGLLFDLGAATPYLAGAGLAGLAAVAVLVAGKERAGALDLS